MTNDNDHHSSKSGRVKGSLEAAKALIKSRDRYQYSAYKFNGKWERENAEYDSSFAEGCCLFEKVADAKTAEVKDRIEALCTLAEIYEDGRIRCRSQFDPIDDLERLECALQFYEDASSLHVTADNFAKDYYRNSIERVRTMIAALPDESDDPE